MLGCLRRLGCLVLLAAIICGGYLTRHRWMPLVPVVRHAPAVTLEWKPVSVEGAVRARNAIANLDRRDGQVFVNVSAADLASYLLDSTALGFGDGARTAEAAIHEDRFLVRTKLRVSDLGLENVPFLGAVAGKTAMVVIGGTLSVERPGLGEWRVKSLLFDAIEVPAVAIPRVAGAVASRMHRASVHDDAFGFKLPRQVADVRVHNGTITLYKAAR
jgi:hypothetical protein